MGVIPLGANKYIYLGFPSSVRVLPKPKKQLRGEQGRAERRRWAAQPQTMQCVRDEDWGRESTGQG
jgi:hypothetical protein